MNLDHLSDEQRRQLQHAQTAARMVGLIIPLGLTLVGVVLYAIWLPRLPNPMATHWGPSGQADGFGSPWFGFVMFPVTGLVLTAMYFAHRAQGLQASLKKGTPVWGPINRLISAIVLGAVVLIFIMQVGTTIPQLDLADAGEMPSVNPTMFAAFGAAALSGVLGFLAQPKLHIAPQADGATAQKLDLTDTERVAWFGSATATQMYWWIVAGANALVLGAFVMTLSVRPFAWQPAVIMGATVVLVLVLTLMCSHFEVRINESGLRARALLGWPTFRVRAADVERVEAASINPFGEFGGWGLRWDGGGQTGIVLRRGEGIRITRANGKKLVITLDDAEGAAAVLATVAARAARERDTTNRDGADGGDTRHSGEMGDHS